MRKLNSHTGSDRARFIPGVPKGKNLSLKKRLELVSKLKVLKTKEGFLEKKDCKRLLQNNQIRRLGKGYSFSVILPIYIQTNWISK